MNYISNIVSSVLNLYIAYNMFEYLLGKELIRKKYQILIYLSICVLDSLAAIYTDRTTFALPATLLMSIFAVSLTYKGPLLNKCTFSILLTAIFALCEISSGMFIVALTHKDMRTITATNDMLYLFGVLLSNMMSFFVVKLIGYISHRQQVKLSISTLIGLFLTSFASLCPLYIIGTIAYDFVGFKDTFTAIVTTVLLIASNLILFHFYEVHLSQEQQRIEYAFMTRQFKVQAEYYNKIVDEQETVNKTIHDIKNTLLAIEGCIVSSDTDGAIRRIHEICRNLDVKPKIFTSNIIVDTILNAKEKEAHNAGLDFEIFASSFSESNVDAIDLGIILGNALDNAIEACKKIPETKAREIYAKILRIEDYISIVIENSVDKPVHIVDGMIATSKRSAFHGYGIKNIKALVEKYDGDVQLCYEANKFSINLLLKSS